MGEREEREREEERERGGTYIVNDGFEMRGSVVGFGDEDVVLLSGGGRGVERGDGDESGRGEGKEIISTRALDLVVRASSERAR